jgi:hypothetical protein
MGKESNKRDRSPDHSVDSAKNSQQRNDKEGERTSDILSEILASDDNEFIGAVYIAITDSETRLTDSDFNSLMQEIQNRQSRLNSNDLKEELLDLCSAEDESLFSRVDQAIPDQTTLSDALESLTLKSSKDGSGDKSSSTWKKREQDRQQGKTHGYTQSP